MQSLVSRKGKRMTTTIIGALFAVTLWTTSSFAQEAEVVASGKHEFRQHCVICHGLNSKGDSVMKNLNLLAENPPDLTRLSKQHGGKFPFWQVYRIVDGREPVKGHGTPAMPVWGDLFLMQTKEGGLASETKATGRLLNIVYYLLSLQKK